MCQRRAVSASGAGDFMLASCSIGEAPGMIGEAPRMRCLIVLVAAMTNVAHADEGAPITLEQALAATAKAPGAQIGGHDIAAAEASAAAASAWPNPSLHLGTSRLTARLIAAATLPLPVFGTVGA